MNTAPSAPVFRLASYNIRKCIGTDRRRRPDRVLDVLAGLGAEIVALQEADLRLGPRRATLPAEHIAARTGLRPVTLDHSTVSLGWHGNAVLLGPRIVAQAVEPIVLPGLEPRGALRLDLLRDGHRLRVVAVHLGLRRRDRMRQMAAIRASLSALEPAPTAILGDFNEWSPSRGMDPLADGFEVHTPAATWHARWPMAPLDRIALSHGLRIHSAGVLESPLARRASDHLPIWAEVALPVH